MFMLWYYIAQGTFLLYEGDCKE